MTHVTVIAEAGVNHNGDLETAKRLVEAAADAGADLVKFQTFKAERVVSRFAPKAAYQRATTDPDESQLAMIKALELSAADHDTLRCLCTSCGVGFFSTGFDLESLDQLHAAGQRLFKIPSGEITNLPLLRHVARLAEEVILSTGMATLDEIDAAVTVLDAAGVSRRQMTILHCTTEYPAPMVDVNLRAMETLRTTFGTAVGYSDHTRGMEVALAAVALGARVIEKHFTLDRTSPGPDHRSSLEPEELAQMIAGIRNLELALGRAEKIVAPSEQGNITVARKSIVARVAIAKGEILTEDNITTKRPATGISPMRWDDVVGRAAMRDFAEDEPIEI